MVRSRTSSNSKLARAPNTWNTNRPPGVVPTVPPHRTALMAVDEIAHRCDNTLCQQATHWQAPPEHRTGPSGQSAAANSPDHSETCAVPAAGPSPSATPSEKANHSTGCSQLGVRSGERYQLALWD
jgi:hypothetical protein